MLGALLSGRQGHQTEPQSEGHCLRSHDRDTPCPGAPAAELRSGSSKWAQQSSRGLSAGHVRTANVPRVPCVCIAVGQPQADSRPSLANFSQVCLRNVCLSCPSCPSLPPASSLTPIPSVTRPNSAWSPGLAATSHSFSNNPEKVLNETLVRSLWLKTQ